MTNKFGLVALSICGSFVLLLSGCSFGPNNKEIACEQMADVIAATQVEGGDGAQEVLTSNAFLGSALDVWLDNGGLQDDLYKLLAGYQVTLQEFSNSVSATTATAYLDYQDENMIEIEKLCGLDKKFRHSLEVSAGCFSGGGDITADLQANRDGSWKSESKYPRLRSIDLCDADYPLGSDFRVSRSIDDVFTEFRVVFTLNSGTFESGKTKYTTCGSYASGDENTLNIENNWCD
jgi:hypothetical protein